ncbi:MAG: hypothetical protein KKF68_00100 [Nanoarchaeota archaeon]|nr:hypothetical protein [Nanoarchaeota archaeon]
MYLKKRFDKRGKIAILEIFILLLGIIAISYAIGSEIKLIKARAKVPPATENPTKNPPLGDLSGGAVQKGAGGAEAATGTATTIMNGFLWATIIITALKMFGITLGDSKYTTKALRAGAFWGVMSYYITDAIDPTWAAEKGWWDVSQGAWVGIGVGLLIFEATYKKVKVIPVTFNCLPWEAPTGGGDCEKCNEREVCSEYMCKSLGQACELINKGTEEEACAWVNPHDVTPPIIETWEDALLPDYKYSPDNTISPPDRGVKVINTKSTTDCAKAFTPLSFGITLDEPGKCKIDYIRKGSFDEMAYLFGESGTLKYEHTQTMSLPGPEAFKEENITLQNDGEYELYVRCQDANGNYNTANFVFRYCVEKGPDTTPPLIVNTNLLNNMPIAYNQTSLEIEVYVNEPAECKWSHRDQDYDKMEEQMVCSSSIFEMNAQMLYECSTKLTGIVSKEKNSFYFRCKDKPRATSDRNTNTESYVFNVLGTQPLVISTVEPNNTLVKDSTESVKVTIKVETAAGHEDGKSICYYSETDDEEDYIMFYKTQSHVHAQELWLSEGRYDYFIKCVDLGGNSDKRSINFDVESDISAPSVVRVYHEESYLKLITNEKAECVYDTMNCNYQFDDGTSISVINEVNHYTDWDTKKEFFIKCQDEYRNQPLPNECSIIVRPLELGFR